LGIRIIIRRSPVRIRDAPPSEYAGLEAVSFKAFFVGQSYVGNCEGKKQKEAFWDLSRGIGIEDPWYLVRYV
jgi:hypothetical protein